MAHKNVVLAIESTPLMENCISTHRFKIDFL